MYQLPILNVFHSSFQLSYFLGLAPHVHFTCSSLEFPTIQSWPCLIPLPLACGCPCSYACSQNSSAEQSRTPWPASMILPSLCLTIPFHLRFLQPPDWCFAFVPLTSPAHSLSLEWPLLNPQSWFKHFIFILQNHLETICPRDLFCLPMLRKAKGSFIANASL